MAKLKTLAETLSNRTATPETLFTAIVDLARLFLDNSEGVSAFELMSGDMIARCEQIRLFFSLFLLFSDQISLIS